jgi:hypothetical protein
MSHIYSEHYVTAARKYTKYRLQQAYAKHTHTRARISQTLPLPPPKSKIVDKTVIQSDTFHWN